MFAIICSCQAICVLFRIRCWGPVMCCLDVLADDVGFADPGALGVRDDHGDCVACFLESVDEREDVWR